MEPQPNAPENGIYCSACGHNNPSWRTECEQCKTVLVSPDRIATAKTRERPGCVTAYAILLGIAAGIFAISGIFGGFLMPDAGLGFTLISLVIAGLFFLLVRGLWQLKNWARIIIIVLQSLGILGSLIQGCNVLNIATSYGFSGEITGAICGTVIGLGISGYIIYWFATNGEYFS